MSLNDEEKTARSFGQHVFLKVASIRPECSPDGKVSALMPQLEYKNQKRLPLHKYGGGSFCKFQIKRTLVCQGVYILTENDKVMRVGECVNLSSRFNDGYGQIAPRNCYKGGQRSNCMVNNLILRSGQKGNEIILWFYRTEGYRAIRKAIESELIVQFRPPWNLSAV